MNTDQITDLGIEAKRAKEVSGRALDTAEQVFEVLEVFPHSILPEPGQRMDLGRLKSMADYILYMEQKDLWGKRGYPPPLQAAYLPLFSFMDIKQITKGNLKGYGSWLYRGSKPGTYVVVFDGAEITRNCRTYTRNLDSVILKLVLHELAHAILHREQMFALIPAGSTMAKDAEADWEIEAWLFAATLLGLAVGDHAYHSKIHGKPDQSWLRF